MQNRSSRRFDQVKLLNPKHAARTGAWCDLVLRGVGKRIEIKGQWVIPKFCGYMYKVRKLLFYS